MFWLKGLFLCCFCMCCFFYRSSNSQGFNSLLNKDIDANVTCGSPPEIYFRTQEGVLHPRLRTPLICNATDPVRSQPPQYMIDDDLVTFWQSKASIDRADIRIDLNQEVYGYELSMTFGDYRRPEQIAFYKSKDFGVTYEPWHFLVSPPALEQCRDVFNMPVTYNPQKVDTVICQQYPSYFPMEYNETFSVDMNGRQRGDGSSASAYHTPEILSWMKITNLKIVFTGLYQKFDRLSTAWHHYTVREIGLAAKCNCHGYADGFDCPIDPVTKQRKCRCQGNTCGLYCEQCCSAYNQYPWQPSGGAPWVWNATATCQACNCHNHSNACVYNQSVADRGLSLDTDGQYRGGGVCVDCKHNTEGINCEKCKTYFYRAVNESRTTSDSCKECGCSTAGTLAHSNMTYLDCVRDEEAMKFHVGKRPGDCYCKQNVIGRTCDMCKDEFYHLTQDNVFGCKGCQCFLPGTVNRSNICEKDENGQCPCKENTHGRNCIQCKAGFYNLTDEDINGCQDCECDPGASIPGTFCNNITGTCECLPHIFGKQCKSIETRCYYPDLHYISAEKSIYEEARSNLSIILDIPKNAYYRIMIRYSLQISSVSVNIALMDNEDGRVVNATTKTFLECLTSCYHRLSSEFLYLEEGELKVLINSAQNELKLDKVIAIPREFYLDTVLGDRASSHFQFQCNIDDNDMRFGTLLEGFCLSNVFSLTIAFNGHPLNCSCNPIGSYNHTTCDPHGGQCYCKPGVTGRDCSQCLPQFYGFSSSGCNSCACNGPDKQCNVTTGWCNCPINTALRTCESCQCNGNSDRCMRSGECLDCQNNTTGFYCERCVSGTYGNASAADCKDCLCHAVGSINEFCDDVTGQCSCKTNIIGRDCSQCHVNTYNMSHDGCMPCTCNADGSSSLQCDDTGQCPCLENVSGLKCSQCSLGYYGLPTKPCEACGCNTIGSVNGTVCSNDDLGMCACKAGVSGRACDTCQRMYTNFSSAGCSQCSPCPRNLQHVLNGVIEGFLNVTTEVEKLQNFTKVGDYFDKTALRLEIAKTLGDEYAMRITTGEQECVDLINSFTSGFFDLYNKVTEQNQKLSAIIPLIENQTENAYDKVLEIREKTRSSNNFTDGLHEFLEDVVLTFVNLQESSLVKINEARILFLHLSNINLNEDLAKVDETLNKARNLSQFIGNIAQEVVSQDALARALQTSVDEAVNHFTETRNQSDANHENFVKKIQNIYGTFSTASELVENIQTTNENSRNFIERATAILEHSGTILHDATENLKAAEVINQQLKNLVTPVSGQLEISMLQYDFTESVFLMKILQARDLLGRDFPSGLSDPYAIISIIPAWRGQGSQMSRIINETLSPIFPFYDIFRFNIRVNEIPETKVLISLYDYDSDGPDDSLGEVVINLEQDDFFNRIVTKWFTVQPKGMTQLNAGDFNADDIGLLDMNILLKYQINQIKPELTTVEAKIEAARLNVTNLHSIVLALNRSLQEAVEHSQRPIEVLGIFGSVLKLINETVRKANETRIAIDDLMSYLRDKSVEEINNNFNTAYRETEEFYEASLLRNSSKPDYLEEAIISANQTFRSVLPLWHLINKHLPDLQAKTAQFQAESLQESSIRQMVSFASNVSHISMVEISRLEKECEQLLEDINLLNVKIKEILSAHENHSRYINEGIELITKAESKLNENPSESVLAALPIKENFEQTRDGVSQRIITLEEKMARIQNSSRIFNFAMRFLGNGSTVFKPSKKFQLNSKSDYVEFDFKTNSSRGGIIYVITTQKDLSKSLRVFLTFRKLCVSTDFGPGPNTICHPSDIDTGEWFRVRYTRYKLFHSLTLIDTDGQYTTVNITSTQGVYDSDYNNETTIYLGGLPPGFLPTVLSYYTFYDGVLDHLRINSETFHLWQPEERHGQELFHVNRRFPKHPTGPVHGASFFGTGGIWHKMGQFSLNHSEAEIRLEFRTLHENGVLVEVSNGSEVSVLDLFLQEGYVIAVLKTGSSQQITLRSGRSIYNSGQWYNLSLTISENQMTLNMTHTESNTQDSRRVQLEGGSSMQDGTQIVVGGSRVSFAGDIKNLKLSNASQSLVLRDFLGSEWIRDDGVSYDGIIKGDIHPGYRFYGYLPYKGHGSYSAVDRPNEMVKQLQFTFKTLEKNAVLVYSSKKNESTKEEDRFFYIALWNGYLYISYHNSDFSNLSPLYYKERLLNNNMWQTVALNYTNNRFDVFLNDKLIHSGWFGNVHQLLTLGQLLYVGGVESSFYILLPVPVHWSFQGDFQTFSVNSQDINLLSGRSEGVSIAGITSATVIPTSPPTIIPTAGPQCQSAPGRPRHSSDVDSVRLGAMSYEYNTTIPSFLGFTLTDRQKEFFKSSVVITLELRALTKNGLVFYAANSERDPSNFISLELVDGRLRYQFRSPTGQVTMETRNSYALNGVWYKIYLLRIFQFGAIVIPQTKEYHNNRHSGTASMITITTPFFIGGLPNHVAAPSLVHRNLSFVGCIRNIEISSSREDVTLDLSNPDLTGSSVGQCYSDIEPGAYFNGKAWMKFYDVSLSRDFSVSLQFRTYQRDGLLFALDASEGLGLILQQKSGKLLFNYTNESGTTQLSWMPSSNTTQDSYVICQLDWYHVQITKKGTKVSMVINRVFEVTKDVVDRDGLTGTLFLGQFTDNRETLPFYGCLKDVHIDGILLDISRPSLQANTELSCPVDEELDNLFICDCSALDANDGISCEMENEQSGNTLCTCSAVFINKRCAYLNPKKHESFFETWSNKNTSERYSKTFFSSRNINFNGTNWNLLVLWTV